MVDIGCEGAAVSGEAWCEGDGVGRRRGGGPLRLRRGPDPTGAWVPILPELGAVQSWLPERGGLGVGHKM